MGVWEPVSHGPLEDVDIAVRAMLQKLREPAIYNVIVTKSKVGDVEVARSLTIALRDYAHDGTVQMRCYVPQTTYLYRCGCR